MVTRLNSCPCCDGPSMNWKASPAIAAVFQRSVADSSPRRPSDAEMERIARIHADPKRRVLFKGATIVPLTESGPAYIEGDLLIEGSKIVALERSIETEADVLDCSGTILIPGMHDTHHHCWQGVLRRLAPNADIPQYFACTHNGFAQHYRPEDMYVGNLLSALTSLDYGITGLLDFSHNSRTTRHSDAAIAALEDSGIRGVYAFGTPYAGQWDGQWPDDLGRLLSDAGARGNSRVSIRFAEASFRMIQSTEAMTRRFELARRHGVEISVDGVYGAPASDNILRLSREGLLGPDVTLIHCTDLSDEAWTVIAGTGTKVSLAVTSDMHYGIGTALPPIQKAIDYGIKPSLSVDAPVALSSDMFTQMRATLYLQRMNAHAARSRSEAMDSLAVADVLRFATVNGAHANGLLKVCGTLEAGKEADLVLLDATALNTMPLNDVFGTVVQASDARNIASVWVAGQPVKWNGTFVGVNVARLLELVEDSRHHLFESANYRSDPTKRTFGTFDV